MNWLFDRKLSQYLVLAAGMSLVVGAALVGWMRLLADPHIILLRSQHAAEWIRVDRPFDPVKLDFNTSASFQTAADFGLHCNLEVTALRRVSIFVDEAPVFDSGSDLSQWKTVYLVPVPAGHHQLRFDVTNQRGPSLLRVGCPATGWASNATWKASVDGQNWSPAALADDQPDPRLPPQFASTSADLLRLLPLWGSLFVVGFFFCLRASLRGPWVRWALLLAWIVLAANNIMKVPLGFGYDADSHYLYIHYVAKHLSLPRPDAGWQYFQSPLYYILSAVLQRSLILLGVADQPIPYLLRLIPLACGAAMIELCFRISRILFPDREDLQAIATLVGGLLPVNIYMSQAVSNEPLGAVFSAWITLIALKLLIRDDASKTGSKRFELLKKMMIVGIALGLGLLTKMNLLLWVIPLGAAIAVALIRSCANLRSWMESLAAVVGTTLCISAAWFIRNLTLIHRPFYLESSAAHDPWWQDPGYRTPKMFYEFGHVFARPIFNGLFSVWDCLYGTLWGNGIPTGRPPWNYGLMSCCLWLALLPTIAVLIGIVRALFGKSPHLWFAVLALGCFITAILYVYLTLPIYSCAKASYLLGTAPCIGLLAAAGCDSVMKNRWLSAVIGGAVICWAASAYMTYFVVN